MQQLFPPDQTEKKNNTKIQNLINYLKEIQDVIWKKKTATLAVSEECNSEKFC